MPHVAHKSKSKHRKSKPKKSGHCSGPSKARVSHGSAPKSGLMTNKWGRVVSKKKHAAGMRAYERLKCKPAAFAKWRANAGRRGRAARLH